MRARLAVHIALSAVALASVTGIALADTIAPFTLDLSQLGGPVAMSGTTVVSGVNLAYGLAATADGSLLFGQAVPTSPAGIVYGNGPAIGSIWKAPMQPNGTLGAPVKLIDNLNGIVTNVRTLSDGTILVDSGSSGLSGSGTRTMSFYSATGQSAGTLSFSYPPGGWEHSTGMSFTSPNPDGSTTVYFIVGSQADATKTASTVSVNGLGLNNATLNGDSVYRMTISSSGGSVQVAVPPEQIVTGVRNPFGLSLDSAGDLVVGNNGIDGPHVQDELGADTLGIVPQRQIGNQIYDFGFPDSYVDFQTGTWVNGDPNAVPPLVAFLPVNDSHGNPQSAEGLAGMGYLAPGSLPFVGALGGEIVTFHGVFDGGGVVNYDNALLYYDFASGEYVPILDAGLAGVGHIDSVLVSNNVLYLEDMSAGGFVNSETPLYDGAIYAFSFATPEPSTFILGLAALVAIFVIGRLPMASDKPGRGVVD